MDLDFGTLQIILSVVPCVPFEDINLAQKLSTFTLGFGQPFLSGLQLQVKRRHHRKSSWSGRIVCTRNFCSSASQKSRPTGILSGGTMTVASSSARNTKSCWI